jgi:ATP-binding cassette, subfamily B, bacterial
MEERKVSTKELLGLLWQHAKKQKGLLGMIGFFVVFANTVDLINPFVYKLFIDGLVNNDAMRDSSSVATQMILLIVTLFGVSMVGWIGWRITSLATAVYIPNTMARLSREMTLVLFRHSVRFYQNQFVGSLVKKVFRIADSFEQIFSAIAWQFIGIIITLVGSFAVLYTRNTTIAWILLAWSFVAITGHFLYSRWKSKFDLEQAESDSKVAGQFSDMLTNFENIKLFTGIKNEKKTLKETQGIWVGNFIKAWRLSEYADAAQAAMMISGEAILLYVAFGYWQEGLLTVGDFALIQGYYMAILSKVWNIGRAIRQVYRAIANGKESAGILLMQPEIKEMKSARDLGVEKGEIVFTGVRFGYNKGQQVLKDYEMTFKAGKRYALVGPSGSGKSTVGKLVLRLFDIQRGKILIDGQEIKKVTLESLRSQISVVPQESVLFHRSLMENIRYGRRDATDEEVMEAAKKARCHEFITHLEDGYETFVGERGVKLSGGERQRVAIARAILKNAPILVLDEATSSLDSESEAMIQEALDHLMKGKTTIVIAHRLSTIMKMDQIVVMEEGKVVDAGSHKQLVRKKNGLYRKLWKIQAGGFLGE